jgi:FkbM family methyltransferase
MHSLMQVPGVRSLAWRLGRRLYQYARREGANSPWTNGEYWLLEELIGRVGKEDVVLLDIGANRGDWSAIASELLRQQHKCGMIHAFDPAQVTFDSLVERFRSVASVRVHDFAISNESRETDFFVVAPMAGTNSLHPIDGAAVQRVTTQTVDDFVESNQLDRIAMVKTDTEGHDFSVLEGAEKTLQAGRVDVWQFEYNHRWAANRASLKSVFDLIEGTPYRIGKLYGNGIEVHDQWHFELDRFFETNYLLIRRDSLVESVATTVCFDHCNVAKPRS